MAHTPLPDGGVLIVYERLIDDARRTNAAALLSSLNMLLMSEGGFDFSAADCKGWMREAGKILPGRGLRLKRPPGATAVVAGSYT